MRFKLFCNPESIKNTIGCSLTVLYTVNHVYQITATGGLINALVTLMAGVFGHQIPNLLQITIILTAGLLSLAITKHQQHQKPPDLEINTDSSMSLSV